MNITNNSDGIRINGHRGTWYVIDTTYFRGQRVFLLEHETYGDMAAGLIVDRTGNIILDDVWNGFTDLEDI